MRKIILVIFLTALVGGPAAYIYGRGLWVPVYQQFVGKRTVAEVIELYGLESEKRLLPHFKAAGVSYPPKKITLLAVKDTKSLELWAGNESVQKLIKSYTVQAASGVLGPKLLEGDKQVPEGVYKLEYLNPNSSYHLSMKLNYPNDFDRKHANIEGRNQPGTNIFIHGKSVSIGCLALGDKAIEELFVLVAKVGRDKVEVAITPKDPRKTNILDLAPAERPWIKGLYSDLTQYYKAFQNDA